jgi:DNA polymerase-3 subunit delta
MMAKSSTEKPTTVGALAFLLRPENFRSACVYVVHGDDLYLKAEVIRAIRQELLGGEDEQLLMNTFSGKETQLRDVLDALATLSLFSSGPRLVIVEEADSFVSQYREGLESYVARPSKGGVLVLEVKTWPANTRLAKAVSSQGLTIDCRSHDSCKPQERRSRERELKTWLVHRAKVNYQARMDMAAADVLLELLPAEPGILDQEIGRLALLAGPRQAIDAEFVRGNVGGWRVRAAWDMIDAAAEGRAAEALGQLERLIASGEKPQVLLAQLASSLRPYALAAELIEAAKTQRQRLPVATALSQAGVLPFKFRQAEEQLRQIGWARARKLMQWLLAADLAMKGHNSPDERARIELERLIVRLSGAARAAVS